MRPRERARSLFVTLYGEEVANEIWPELAGILDRFKAQHPKAGENDVSTAEVISERDAVLITYGDQFQRDDQTPLHTLTDFLTKTVGDAISTVHILPFFPYTSDDGFSVVDYRAVDPELGDWRDIARLGADYRLMFDAVINHVSQASAWFQGFRRGEAEYADYFITVDPATDLSSVVRPRTLPLLTPVETDKGMEHVWTTFSADQIDLNFANPQVLLEIVDILLDYVAHGAAIIRLDAIAYLWKEIGASCIHLPQTHVVVKLWRAILDDVAPDVILITETNVPHAENISYFGEPLADGGADEAQMVYNFSLAPLTLHAFRTGDARPLSDWAATLRLPAPGTAFFNFIASHDGIGVRPAEGILNPEEIQALADRTLAHGGHVSYRANSDGSTSAYELNITLYDFLNDPASPDPHDVSRFLASQAILLSLAGVPGIYIHSLFGSRNCHECVAETGRARSINRQKFLLPEIEQSLARPDAHQRQVLNGYLHLLRQRGGHPAFHPAADQRILDLNPSVLGLVRGVADADPFDNLIVVLINVSDQTQSLSLDLQNLDLPLSSWWHDLVGKGRYLAAADALSFDLDPYQIVWLTPRD